MNRRSFLLATAAAPAAAIPIAAIAALAPIPPFVKAGAIQAGVAADFSEVSLDDALTWFTPPAKRYAVVVPQSEEMYAVRVLDEVKRLRGEYPGNVPSVELRVDASFADTFEWGIVAEDGRCFYSPGA